MRQRTHLIVSPLCLAALFAAAVAGLGRSLPENDNTSARRAISTYPVPVAEPVTDATNVADLGEIRFQRKFRVLIAAPGGAPDRLGRHDTVADARRLIEKFAEEQFLLPTWVKVPRWQDLVPALLRGEGDLVASRMQIREYRTRGADFTVPVDRVREVLVSRSGDVIDDPRDLRGREIALSERSTFWPRLLRMRRAVPGIQVRTIAHDLGPEVVMQRVLSMEYDLAVVDPGSIALHKPRWQGLRLQPEFSSSGSIALGINPEASDLKDALDDFLTREQLARREPTRRRDDLPGIARDGVLRVLTRNNAASYFIWRGKPLGFEYELISRFAKQSKLSLEMIVARSRDQLLPSLLRGEADIVAAGLAATADRHEGGVAFTRPYKESYELVVTRAGDDTLVEPADLAGRTVTVRQSSPAWKLLQRLADEGLEVTLEAAPEDVETEEIIARVASGLYDVTVADAYSTKVALTWRDDVRSAFALDGPVPVAWAVREDNPELLAALNDFLDREYRQLNYNVIYARYFKNPRSIRSHVEHRADAGISGNHLSPYDDIVRRHAAKHGFDWPLIVAIMYRESRFDPKVRSWAGARGLMQLLPVTAQRFGVTDLDDPETSIIGGLRLLDWLYQQMEPELSVKDRTWFALAAYNAGLGHLLDARRLAREMNLDPDRWFENVEKAMLKLSEPEFYRRARHGYVRGKEPVSYVRDIRELYNAYRSVVRS